MTTVIRALSVIVIFLAGASHASAADYTVESIDTAPPEELAKEISNTLSGKAFKISVGKRVLCEVWLTKSWTTKKDFKPTDAVLYPFEPGNLVGVIRYKNKAADYRDQEIAKGVYTLRYGQQPVDGNHVGTSPTRDFLLLSSAEKDQTAAAVDEKTLAERSAEAAGSKHPAMLALKAATGDGKPAITHDETADLWILTAQNEKLPIAIVLVGHAAE